MELTRSLVETSAEAYHETQPLSGEEEVHRDILPEMLTSGDFGWRDAEWIVQWYFRRYLGAYPDAKRREHEAAFGENTYEGVRDTIAAALEKRRPSDAIEEMCSLEGVDVRVASAFLFFINSAEYLVVGDREWEALLVAGELDASYPDTISTEEYLKYNRVCLELVDRFAVDSWTLYRALWRLGTEASGS